MHKKMTRIAMVVAAICAAGVTAGAAVAAGEHHGANHWFAVRQQKALVRHFAVLGHIRASSASATAPLNGDHAATIGDAQVFVSSNVGNSGTPTVCVTYQEPYETARACGAETTVEREGLDIVQIEGGSASLAIVLVPNAVHSVAFTSADGITADVGVENNVAAVRGASIVEMKYVVPGGSTKTLHVR